MANRGRIPPEVEDYRHDAKRKNLPPAAMAAQGKIQEVPRTRYSYDPHLPPELRFDDSGEADQLPELLQEARQRPLTDDEARTLAEALRNQQPWLEWAGKREKRSFDVDPVALHIHERVSAQAILKLARRQPVQRSFFADPELEYRQAVQFYQHDVDWANRLILGDSLVVMHSLARREDLASKVQMIYIDPPYGIKFSSNFQPLVRKRTVEDRERDLTREPEQVKAYRDTWMLGIHSYLAYLRDRLLIARDLLADTGSIFVQIGEENLHRVRMLMDEIFGPSNFCGVILYVTTSTQGGNLLPIVNDNLLWYAKDRTLVKYRSLYDRKVLGQAGTSGYNFVEIPNGQERRIFRKELVAPDFLPNGARVFAASDLTSSHQSISEPIEVNGKVYRSGHRYWSTSTEGMLRLKAAGRLLVVGNSLRFKRYLDDFLVFPMNNVWTDTGVAGFTSERKIYVVQTNDKVIERCLLMTTDPGDLVLDPTCGSGTTAYIAEKWGCRWITIDTSRVAIALARQRLLTSTFEYYQLSDSNASVSGGFVYERVPHVTLKSIANATALDPVSDKWEPVLSGKLATLNTLLAGVTAELRARLQTKLAAKERERGKRAITEADRRRWLLPKEGWQEWEVPYDADPDWPGALRTALEDYRAAWRKKMDEVNATIAASAPQETLYDQPQVAPNVLRVSGPFTVEGVQPVEETLDMDTPIGGAPEEMDTFPVEDEPANVEAYLEKMIRLLRQDGVRFPDNKVLQFERLEPLPHSILHAEGEWGNGAEPRRVAVALGPQYGPITAQQVEQSLREAYRRGYDDLVFAGFTIDGAAQAIVQEDPNPQIRCHLAHIRPDVNMGDLLKDTPSSQLFTVFGLPRVRLEPTQDGEWQVQMEGVDIYDPVTNTIRATKADKVAAWFLDSDYDARTFCITQAFFPDSSAWDKLARALKSVVDPQRFAAFSGTRSLPFQAGEHKRIAVKVIDPRGNEVMRVMALEQEHLYAR